MILPLNPLISLRKWTPTDLHMISYIVIPSQNGPWPISLVLHQSKQHYNTAQMIDLRLIVQVWLNGPSRFVQLLCTLKLIDYFLIDLFIFTWHDKHHSKHKYITRCLASISYPIDGEQQGTKWIITSMWLALEKSSNKSWHRYGRSQIVYLIVKSLFHLISVLHEWTADKVQLDLP